MGEISLEKYCTLALERGATHVKLIHPSSVVTAPWVRLKCQFGCAQYNKGHCCPPYSPTPEQTRAVIDCYHRAILFHFEAPPESHQLTRIQEFHEMVMSLEGEAFKDGYYKAFVFSGGPCRICQECAILKGTYCNFRDKARPSMEGSGIDVYQTVRSNGFLLTPLRDKTEIRHRFCIMLVD